MAKIRRARAKFELEKSYFDATPSHYRFESLEYDRIARERKKHPN